MDCRASSSSSLLGSSSNTVSVSPYHLLFRALSLIPISHFLLAVLFAFLIFLYNRLETHFLHDFFTAFRGDPVSLTYNSRSQLHHSVASKCRILHSRYLATPWLSSPHLQTAFLSFFGNPPAFKYRRQLFHASDGGTIALDWLMSYNVDKVSEDASEGIDRDNKVPIVIIVPGLTSDSAAAYIKHLAFRIARSGSNVVVSNHRGLGGISITSDCFYNAGWTEDLRAVVDHLYQHYPEAPLFIIGTSIGANVLVKYLGEQGDNVPIVGAAAVCSPWDLLICDRFINRKLVQKFYDKVLTTGLQGYAKLHQSILSRLANWEDIEKSRSVREFDNHATRILGKYETVDTFYRRCSSANFVGKVSVPLLCISALDDPVCTKEAIPWDECRANENIILATTPHGGHLGFYEGLSATSLWWVRAVDEFFTVLHTSPLIQRRPWVHSSSPKSPECSIDSGPYINIAEDGMVAAVGHEQTEPAVEDKEEDKSQNLEGQPTSCDRHVNEVVMHVKRWIQQLSGHSRRSMWLLTYIAIVTTWPLVGSALLLVLKRKLKRIALPGAPRR